MTDSAWRRVLLIVGKETAELENVTVSDDGLLDALTELEPVLDRLYGLRREWLRRLLANNRRKGATK